MSDKKGGSSIGFILRVLLFLFIVMLIYSVMVGPDPSEYQGNVDGEIVHY